tara:strand:+ start:982 stop:1476 length:495 start_codon:yes stop_codon:yes gene_type:complete
MLLILLSLVCLTASFNSESVADWYWDFIYKGKVKAAQELLNSGLERAPSQLDRNPSWQPGEPISFQVPTMNGPVPVTGYQPRPVEIGYVTRAQRGGAFVVYYRPLVPRQCVLEPSWQNARSLVRKPKPARVPGDNISRYLSLWGKVLALILFFFGITSVAKNTM